MDTMASLVVGKPIHILGVAAAFFLGHVLLRSTTIGQARRPRALLVVAGAWALYGLWEWLVLLRTPEADIRVDLLVIWPVVLIGSLCGTIAAIRSVTTEARG